MFVVVKTGRSRLETSINVDNIETFVQMEGQQLDIWLASGKVVSCPDLSFKDLQDLIRDAHIREVVTDHQQRLTFERRSVGKASAAQVSTPASPTDATTAPTGAEPKSDGKAAENDGKPDEIVEPDAKPNPKK